MRWRSFIRVVALPLMLLLFPARYAGSGGIRVTGPQTERLSYMIADALTDPDSYRDVGLRQALYEERLNRPKRAGCLNQRNGNRYRGGPGRLVESLYDWRVIRSRRLTLVRSR